MPGKFGFIQNERKGDIAVYNPRSDWEVLHIGSTGQALVVASGLPSWGYPAGLTIASAAQGDILYFDGTNWVRLAAGTAGYLLKTQGAGANPAWQINDNTALIDRTRRITVGLSRATADDSFTGRGGFGGDLHNEVADGVDKTFTYNNLEVPVDIVGNFVIKVKVSNTVANGNIKMALTIRNYKDTDTAPSVLDVAATGYTIGASTNKIQIITVALSTPAAGTLTTQITFGRSDGVVDTNTGILSIWDVWFEMTSDS